MSDILSHRAPTRGRGVSRGGRGGGAVGRGGRNGAAYRSNGDTFEDTPVEDQGELGKLKQKYASQLTIMKEMFPTWTDEDLIIPLEESFGEVQDAISLIAEGHATQWNDVKKKTKEKPKAKGSSGPAADEGSRTGRGGFKPARGGFEGGRGGRGGRGGTADRGSHRGRGGLAPRGGKTANGAEAPATESSEWPATTQEVGDDKPADDTADTKDGAAEIPTWKSIAAGEPTASLVEKAKPVTPAAPMTASEKPAAKSSVPAEPPKKTWASLLHAPPAPPPQAQPAPVAAPKKPESPVQAKVEPQAPVPEPTAAPTTSLPPPQEAPVSLPPPVTTPLMKKSPMITPALPDIATPKLPQTELATVTAAPEISKVPEDPVPEPTADDEETPEAPVESLPSPALEKLTEENLEKIENVAPAPPTSTAASTVATTPIPGNITSLAQASKGLPPAHRAPGHRHNIRRMLDQHEAVVMPRENFVDRAAVQFGSMGLNGDLDDSEEVEQPEKPETVAPPQQSPIGQPKASLPAPVPAPTTTSNISNIGSQQPASIQPPQPIPEPQQQPVSIPRHAPGLAAPIQQPSHNNPLSSSPNAPPQLQQQPSQPLGQSLPRQSGFGADSKFDSYGQQPHLGAQQNPVGQSPYAGYQSQAQQPSQPSADPYANYYSSGDPSRNSAFNNFYNTPYQQGQTQQQAQHQPTEQPATQPRSSSALGGGVGTSIESSQSSTAVAGSQPQSRQSGFGASFQGSEGSQQPGQANPQQNPQQQGHPSQQYPMHPSYYPYYNYMSQMYGHYGSYPKGFYGGSPQAYMSPGGYEHSSSPANYGGFGGPGSQGRDSSVNEYARSGASQGHGGQGQQQQQQQSQHPSLGYGSGMPDYVSSRQQLGGFGAQQQHGLGAGQQGGHAEDTLKPYGEAKAPTGPSGNPAGAPGRPPSTGLSGQSGQSQIPQGQSQQHQQNLMGGYPQHLQGQSGGNTPLMGGNQGVHHNSQQQQQYGMYGGFGSGGYPQYGSQGGNRQQGWGYGTH